MRVKTREFQRTRVWHDEPYGERHERQERGQTKRIECTNEELRPVLAQLAAHGFTVTGCGPDMKGGFIVTADQMW